MPKHIFETVSKNATHIKMPPHSICEVFINIIFCVLMGAILELLALPGSWLGKACSID